MLYPTAPNIHTDSLSNKIANTLACLAIYIIGTFVPTPGIPDDFIRNANLSISNFGGAFDFYVLGTHYSIFTVGIAPYLAAALLVPLLSGFILPLKRLREGSEVDWLRFDIVIYSTALLLAIVSAWNIASHVQSFYPQPVMPLTVESWDPQQPVDSFFIVMTLTCGAAILMIISHIITRRGIGNGIALIIFVEIGRGLAYSSLEQVDQFLAANWNMLRILVMLAIPAAITGAVFAALGAVRKIPLRMEGLRNNATQTPHIDAFIPMRPLLAGAIPLSITIYLVFELYFYVELFLMSDPDYIPGGTPLFDVVMVASLVIFTIVASNIFIHPQDIVDRLRRHGFSIVGTRSETDMTTFIEQTARRLIVPGAVFICLLFLAQKLMMNVFGFAENFSGFFSLKLLVFCAIGADTFKQYQTLKTIYPENTPSSEQSLPDDEDQEETDDEDQEETYPIDETPEWKTVFYSDVILDAELIRTRLDAHGVEARVYANRVLSVAGTLGLWEICKPAFPSFAPNPRLGGGRVMTLVHAEDEVQARAILAEYSERRNPDNDWQ